MVGFSCCVNVFIVLSDATVPLPVSVSVEVTAAVVVGSGAVDLEHPKVAINNKYV